MGRGRKPIPTEVLRLRGSRTATAVYRRDHAAIEAGRPAAPTWLDAEARAEWRRVVPALDRIKVLTKEERSSLAAYCTNWSLFVRLAKQMNKMTAAEIVENRKMGKALNEALLAHLRIAVEFGLTPSSRVKRQAIGHPKEDDFERFMSATKADVS